MSEKLQKYGLIGRSLQHSFSAAYFADKFEHLGVNAVYSNYELAEIAEIVPLLEAKELSGFNVTIPYKEEIIPYLDQLDDSAKACGAVNTVALENGKWIGYNTDVFGFKQSIKPFFKSHHERSIILGTGGASKAVAYVLDELGSDVIFISRNPQAENHFSYEDINERMLQSCFVIVNCTPVGMYPHEDEKVNIPYEFLNNKHLCIDLIYRPKETLFLRHAKANEAVVMNGETMLHQQAEKAWEIWEKL